MPIKLYCDDLRPVPEGWELARTITKAIRLLATQDVSEVSLDHDIIFKRNKKSPDESETFEPVCRYIRLLNMMSEETGFPQIKVYVHSGNPFAYDKYSNILGYKVQPLQTREEPNGNSN